MMMSAFHSANTV